MAQGRAVVTPVVRLALFPSRLSSPALMDVGAAIATRRRSVNLSQACTSECLTSRKGVHISAMFFPCFARLPPIAPIRSSTGGGIGQENSAHECLQRNESATVIMRHGKSRYGSAAAYPLSVQTGANRIIDIEIEIEMQLEPNNQ